MVEREQPRRAPPTAGGPAEPGEAAAEAPAGRDLGRDPGREDSGGLTEDAAFRALRRTWQPVALAGELAEGAIRAYRLLDEELVLVRLGGRLLVARDGCPHKGARFAIGRVRDGELECGYHGWRFDAGGRCTNIPSLIEPVPNTQEKAHLDTFAVRERYGIVWVRLDAGERAPLPELPELEDGAWESLVAPPMAFGAGFRREVENFLDMTHFVFAHATTLGVAASAVAPAPEITPLGSGFQAEAPFPAADSSEAPPGKLQQAHRRRYRYHPPNVTTIRQTFAGGDERLLLHVPSPNTRTSCTVFWALAQNRGFDGPPLADQVAFSTRVLEEDRRMCESQLPLEVPLNPARGGWGVLVTPGDTLANTFQKTFRRFLLAP